MSDVLVACGVGATTLTSRLPKSVAAEDRQTRPIMTKYERAHLLSVRAYQLRYVVWYAVPCA